jgi:hypothetical protein
VLGGFQRALGDDGFGVILGGDLAAECAFDALLDERDAAGAAGQIERVELVGRDVGGGDRA